MLPPLLTFGTIQPCVELLPSVGDNAGTLGGRNPENKQAQLVLSNRPCVVDESYIDTACFCIAYPELKHSLSLNVTMIAEYTAVALQIFRLAALSLQSPAGSLASTEALGVLTAEDKLAAGACRCMTF